MAYAERTQVPVQRSQAEIEKLLTQKGASRFMRAQEPSRAIIEFELFNRRIRFEMPLPEDSKRNSEAQTRARWRALALAIKAKLVSVDSGVETFEQAFLAQIVVPVRGGAVPFWKQALPEIALAYKNGAIPVLALGSGEEKKG